ncbi:hypothetical protein [Acinetobacter faecalis]|uniref:hypothetical protein n=1 Tax=Acinetobacter faecalis TaxID=2665161 RepID=UPI002A90CEFC|nr:hypothetical protein [Acinetobacter faecalis]MDY6451138.1 hypothetical protein [Acinetobacter faecalis]
MKLTNIKIVVFLTSILLFGCATNDSNSSLVRFWNDGFVYSEKEGKANSECSNIASTAFPVQSATGDNKNWHKIHDKCMRERGYRNYSQ